MCLSDDKMANMMPLSETRWLRGEMVYGQLCSLQHVQ